MREYVVLRRADFLALLSAYFHLSIILNQRENIQRRRMRGTILLVVIIMNLREKTKRLRIEELQRIKKEGKITDTNELVALMLVKFGVTRRTSLEEINAVMNYDF